MAAHTLFAVGGVRSGKSAFAQAAVESWSAARLYVATMQVTDEDMLARVERHRRLRGEGWLVVEPADYDCDMVQALQLYPAAGSVLIDSVGPWISGMLCGVWGEAMDDNAALARVDALAETLKIAKRSVAVVSDEVGLGLVPPDRLSRRFADILGYANQRLAAAAEDAYFVSCGCPVRLKG